MTQEIIEMAQECGLIGMRPHLDGIYSEALVAFAKLVAAKAIAGLESQEHNFCPRFGKRTNDIHTCTPPRDNT